eukprot:767619-Hanusia_phi.AAC.3
MTRRIRSERSWRTVYDHVGELFDAPVKVQQQGGRFGDSQTRNAGRRKSDVGGDVTVSVEGQSKGNIQGNGIEGNRPSHEKRDELEESRMREEDNNPV